MFSIRSLARTCARPRRQQDQRELRRQRKRLRELCAREHDGEALLEVEDAEDLCKELPRAAIEALCAAVEGAAGEDAARAAVAAAVDEMYGSRGEVRSHPLHFTALHCSSSRARAQQGARCMSCTLTLHGTGPI